MPAVAGEADLRALARRFEESERRVRALVANAPEGDRRELLAEALATLTALRRLEPGRAVERAYLRAFKDALGKRLPAPVLDDIRRLGGSLAKKLDDGVQTASEGSRRAFRAVVADNLDDMQLEAVTARVDDQGQRWAIGRYASMAVATIGREATSRGVRDADPREVEISGGSCDICDPYQGTWNVADLDAWPPYHAHCGCVAVATS